MPTEPAFKPLTSLSKAMHDPRLFGKVFEAASFWTWRTVAKLLDGIPLVEQREIDLFCECTGRLALPEPFKPVRRMAILAGRRAGKDRFLSAVAIWRAALCADWRRYASPGEQFVVILLGADKRQAAILRRYCEGLARAPLLAPEVTRHTAEVIEFRNGSALEIAANDARLVRGRSAIAVLGSEAAHWKTSEHASNSDTEVVAGAEPSMAMAPDGGVMILGSSVHRRAGYMYERYKALHGNDTAEDICWFAPSTTMNPRLPLQVIEKSLATDRAKASAEYLNVWREDSSDFLPPDAVQACTDAGVYERPPQSGCHYTAYCDGAGGTGTDSFAIAIGHRENDVIIIDAIRERKPRFTPSEVIAEYAALLHTYRIRELYADGYAFGFHADEWKRLGGITLIKPDRDTSENYLAALPFILAGRDRVRFPDNSTLRSQLTALERRPGSSSTKEKVDHLPHASAHDDVAAAVCGCLVAASDALSSVEYFRKLGQMATVLNYPMAPSFYGPGIRLW
jgi:hypothetical protein